MKKLSYVVCIAATLAVTPLKGGVVILAELSPYAHAVVKAVQAHIALQIQNINANPELSDPVYLFDKGDYKPHMSLVYVSQEQLTIAELIKRAPDLREELYAVATHHACIQLTPFLRDAQIDFFPGKESIRVGGKEYTTYYHVVIKLVPCQQLNTLVRALERVLEKYNWFSKPACSFTAHITVGRLYGDQYVATLVKVLKRHSMINLAQAVACVHEGYTVRAFKLRAHDSKESTFSLIATEDV